MRLILTGCEYAGTTTLVNNVCEWLERAMGTPASPHDHFKFPHLSHAALTAEEQEQLLGLSPLLKEQYQRYHVDYHVGDQFYRGGAAPHRRGAALRRGGLRSALLRLWRGGRELRPAHPGAAGGEPADGGCAGHGGGAGEGVAAGHRPAYAGGAAPPRAAAGGGRGGGAATLRGRVPPSRCCGTSSCWTRARRRRRRRWRSSSARSGRTSATATGCGCWRAGVGGRGARRRHCLVSSGRLNIMSRRCGFIFVMVMLVGLAGCESDADRIRASTRPQYRGLRSVQRLKPWKSKRAIASTPHCRRRDYRVSCDCAVLRAMAIPSIGSFEVAEADQAFESCDKRFTDLLLPSDESWELSTRKVTCLQDSFGLSTTDPAKLDRLIRIEGLDVGACFNQAPETGDLLVEHVGCSEPWEFRVLSFFEIEGSELYPGEGFFDRQAYETCDKRVTNTSFPSVDAWALGERTVTCVQSSFGLSATDPAKLDRLIRIEGLEAVHASTRLQKLAANSSNTSTAPKRGRSACRAFSKSRRPMSTPESGISKIWRLENVAQPRVTTGPASNRGAWVTEPSSAPQNAKGSPPAPGSGTNPYPRRMRESSWRRCGETWVQAW